MSTARAKESENTMKKLMKSAMLLASVGAMLCFAGCKEKTPQEQLVDIMVTVDAECAKLGCKSLCGAEMIDKTRTMLVEEAQKKLAKAKPSIDAFMEYVGILKNLDSELKKVDVSLSDSGDDIVEKLRDLLDGSPTTQQTDIKDMRNTKHKLSKLVETTKQFNDICTKKTGKPYLNKREMGEAYGRVASVKTQT